MKSKTYKNVSDLAVDLGLTAERGLIAEMKANLTKEIIKAIGKKELTHKEVSELSGVPRSAITGIINGSLQRHQFADPDGISEIDLVDRNGDAAGPRMPCRAHISHAVGDRQQGAAVNRAGDIGVLRHHELAHFGFGLANGFVFHKKSAAMMAGLLRNAGLKRTHF